MAKRRDDIDLIMYRLDTIEKRMDTIERALLNKNDSSINTELLSIVLNMVRQQTHAPQRHSEQQAHGNVASEPSSIQHDKQENCGSSFLFNRRKTII